MINAVLSVVILIEISMFLWVDSRLSKRITNIEDKYQDLCDEYESISTSLDLIERKFEAKMLDDTAEWVIKHVPNWEGCNEKARQALMAIASLAGVRGALKRQDKHFLTDRDIVLANREICRQYKRLLEEY